MLYINKIPHKGALDKYQSNVCVLNLHNLRLNTDVSPLEAIEFFLGWFEDIKQPTESKIRSAMLLVIHDSENEFKYCLKSGGGSVSDKLYSASVECLVMDENGNDKMVTFYTKYSNIFENVLITSKEILDAITQNLSNKEIIKKEIDIVNSIPLAFIREIHKNPKFEISDNLIILINKYKSLFLSNINKLLKDIETDIKTFSSAAEYLKVYLMPPNLDQTLLFQTKLCLSKKSALNNLKSQYIKKSSC